MASLKDTIVNGSLRATDTIYSTTNQFQTLKIPTSSNGTTYGPGTDGQILKSNGTSVYWSSDNIILEKTYENYTVASNNQNSGVVYFGTVTINDTTNYYTPWWVHYILEVTTSESQTQGYYDVWIGCAGSEVRYKIWNDFYSGSYYPIYHHRILYPNSGYSSQGAHLGFRVQSARSPTTLARTYKISILETYGCSVAFKDNLTTYQTLFDSTYYTSGEYSGTGNGLQETGDSDSNGYNLRTSYPRLTTGAVGIGRYTLFMETKDGTYQSITSTFNNTGTSHVMNTAQFKPERVFYRTRNDELAANNSSDNANSWFGEQDFIDARYSFNCGSTLTGRKPLYLVGTIDNEGFFNLADVSSDSTVRWYAQDPPTTEDGKVYIYLGMVYTQDNSSNINQQYRVQFEMYNPMYWFKNGRFRLYESTQSIPITTYSSYDTQTTSYNNHIGCNIIYNTTAPSTRPDGTALQVGDIWLQPV